MRSLGLVLMPACLSFGFVLYGASVLRSLSVGVFAFVCSCLPLLFDITSGRSAGLKQPPAEA